MAKPLISIHDLISDSWRSYLKTWNQTFSRSVWLLVVPVLMLVAGLLMRQAGPVDPTIASLFFFAEAILAVWVTIRLTILILAKDAKKPAEKNDARMAWKLFIPFTWISLLEGLAVLGGTLLLVLPGIWLTISLMFSRYFLLEDGLRGTQSLAASHALIKGRWWATFWRIVLPGFLFMMLLLIIMAGISSIVSAIGGFDKLQALMDPQNGSDYNLLATSISSLLQAIGQIIFLPLFLIWQVKLFHALKASR